MPGVCVVHVQVAARHGERVLETPHNSISFGVTLDGFAAAGVDPSLIGSMLFTRCVSGTRVVVSGEEATICGTRLQGFGSSTDNYPYTYMTAACAIGVTRAEIDRFVDTLDKTLLEAKKKRARNAKREGPADAESAAAVGETDDGPPQSPEAAPGELRAAATSSAVCD